MMKNCSIQYIGNKTIIKTLRVTKTSSPLHEYTLQKLTASSAKRLSMVMSSYRVENKRIDLDPIDLNPTIYFNYGYHKVEQVKVGKSLLYPESNTMPYLSDEERDRILGE